MPTMDEVKEISRSQNVTLNTGALGGNAKYAPHAFTESGCIEGKTRRQPNALMVMTETRASHNHKNGL